jgi:two-component sensor histidine kinase
VNKDREDQRTTTDVGRHPGAGQGGCDANRKASETTELRYLANFERLVISLSGRFINLAPEELDKEITAALKTIGSFAKVDRSYVFLFSADGKRISNTHEWCSAGIDPAIGNVQDAPVDTYPWVMPKFTRGEVVHVPDVSRLPPEAERERREMQSQGIRSLINLPLVCAGRTLGFIGFDSVRLHKTWREDQIKLLKVVGEIVAGAIERTRATTTLKRQAQMEKMIARISTRFINVGAGQLDWEIGRALEEIGVFTDVSRCYLFQLSDDRRHLSNTHEWCAPGIAPHIHRLQGLVVDEFGYSIGRMRRGDAFHVPRVDELPAEANRERREFEREGIQSLINVPVMAKGDMIGILGFDAVHARPPWSDDDIRLLQLASEILANALASRSAEERIQVSLREKEVLLREIHHRVKNNLQVIHSLLYLQSDAIRDRVSPLALNAFRQSQGRIKSMATIHDRLYRDNDLANIDFDDYLHALIPDLVRLYDGRECIATEIRAHGSQLGIDAAIPCGLVVNELVTNSLTHAFPDSRSGRIEIGLARTADNRFELMVADDGIGFPPGEDWRNRRGLGLQLVSDLVAQLSGEVSFETGAGTRFRIRFQGE